MDIVSRNTMTLKFGIFNFNPDEARRQAHRELMKDDPEYRQNFYKGLGQLNMLNLEMREEKRRQQEQNDADSLNPNISLADKLSQWRRNEIQQQEWLKKQSLEKEDSYTSRGGNFPDL